MNPSDVRQPLVDTELLVLRAMCQGTPQKRVWNEGVQILRDYRFRESDHQVIFETLREINTDDPRIIRGLLPTRLTNKGFPTIDVDTLFVPHNLTEGMAVMVMHSLCAAGVQFPLGKSTAA